LSVNTPLLEKTIDQSASKDVNRTATTVSDLTDPKNNARATIVIPGRDKTVKLIINRGFSLPSKTNYALMDLESTLLASGTEEREKLFNKMQALDSHNVTAGLPRMTKLEKGTMYISAYLLRFSDNNTSSGEAMELTRWVKFSTLSTNLNEYGQLEYNKYRRAIDALNSDGSNYENERLAQQIIKLNRGIQLTITQPTMTSNLAATIQETNSMFHAARLPAHFSDQTADINVRYSNLDWPGELIENASKS